MSKIFLKGGLPSPEMDAMVQKALAVRKPEPTYAGMSNIACQKTTGHISNCKGFSPDQIAAIVKLYDDLVQDPEIRASRPVNVGLIANDGFQVFESTLGQEAWGKLKMYYGIDCKADHCIINDKELQESLTQLRTMNTACYYIDGYWRMIQTLHSFLDEFQPCADLDERAQILTGAKIVFLVLELMCGDHFPQKYMKHNADAWKNASKKKEVFDIPQPDLIHPWLADYAKVTDPANATNAYGPEQLCYAFEKFKDLGPKCIITAMVMGELLDIERRGHINDVMRFAELSFSDDGSHIDIVSINTPNPFTTIAAVMKLKRKVYPEITVKAAEWFFFKQFVSKNAISELIETYIILRTIKDSGKSLEELFPSISIDYSFAHHITRKMSVYCLTGNAKRPILISGWIEAERLLRLVEHCKENDTELPFFWTKPNVRGPIGRVLVAIIIGQKLNCPMAFDVMGSMLFAQELLKMDHGFLAAQIEKDTDIDLCSAAQELGITSEHLKNWGSDSKILEKETTTTSSDADAMGGMNADTEALEEPPEAVATEKIPTADIPVTHDAEETTDFSNSKAVIRWLIKWAKQKGYTVQDDEVQDDEAQDDEAQHKLILNVLVEGNTELIRAFAMKEIDESTFMKKIGLASNYAYMCFSIENINCEELVAHILTSIRKKNVPVCSIRLYKYLTSKKIKCGLERARMKKNPTIEKYLSRM